MKLKSPDKGTVSTIPTDVSVVKLGFIMQKQKKIDKLLLSFSPKELTSVPLGSMQLLFLYNELWHFATMWHFDKCRCRRACAAPF